MKSVLIIVPSVLLVFACMFWSLRALVRAKTPGAGVSPTPADELTDAERALLEEASRRPHWSVMWEKKMKRAYPVALLRRHAPIQAEVSVEKGSPPYALWVRIEGSASYGGLQSQEGGYGPVRHLSTTDALDDAERWWRENCAYRKCREPGHL